MEDVSDNEQRKPVRGIEELTDVVLNLKDCEKTLLVVDDEEEIRNALSRHFRFMGYKVLTAENGVEAMAVLVSNSVGAVISDIVMPIMDGVEFLRAVRREYPMIRVIMITGYVTQEHVMACIRHDADTCVFKPWMELDELESAVENAVGRSMRWAEKYEKSVEKELAIKE